MRMCRVARAIPTTYNVRDKISIEFDSSMIVCKKYPHGATMH